METKVIYGAANVVLTYSFNETSTGSDYITLERVQVGHDEMVDLEPTDYWASLIGGNLDHYWTQEEADIAVMESLA